MINRFGSNRRGRNRRRGEGEGFIYVLALGVVLAGVLTWLFIRRLTDPGPVGLTIENNR